MAAYWPQQSLDTLLCDLESAHHPHNCTLDRQERLAQLAQVRVVGYARSTNEPCWDSCMVAAPVKDETKRVVGSVGIACPLDRCNTKDLQYVNAIKSTADWHGWYVMS